MNRKGKIYYNNGQPFSGEFSFVRNGEKFYCQADEFGNFEIYFEDEWVNQIIADGQIAKSDLDIGQREDLGDIFLSLSSSIGKRKGRIAGGEGKAYFEYKGEQWLLETDREGRFETEYPHSWVDRLVVGGETALENLDIGEGDIGTLEVEGKRSVKLLYEDGSPVSGEEVVWIYHGEKFFGKTNSEGLLEMQYQHSWVDSMVVGGLEVRKDWDLGDKNSFEDFTLPNPATKQADGDVLGLSGQVFWSDGTAVDKSLEVRWADPTGYTWTSEAPGGYAREDGTFLVPLSEKKSPEALSGGKWFVGGHEPRFSRRTGASRFFLVLSDISGGGKSDTGGLITGFTVDRDGDPVDGVRVRGEVRSNAFLGFLQSPEDIEVRSGRRGDFALGFRGGAALKAIYLNGNYPSRVYIKNLSGEEIDISVSSGIQAGSFSLYFVVPRPGLFS